MAIFKCKMCGGNVQAAEGAVFGTCDSCGSDTVLPKASDERKANLFNRANHFRRLNEFDKALQAYESILNEDNSDAEAHWGVVLSRYGIEYVEDPATHQRVPTCHRVQSESILADADYLAALEHAPDGYTRSLYEDEAKKIAGIQKGILAISSKEEPCDVFICYKETTDGGSRTKDSVIAQDIHHQLTSDGYKVFFARITLEDKLGQQYEPYIFSALNSAKVMLVIGTRKEHFEAPWVKNEWSRFLSIAKKDRSRLLIPCYRDMDAYDIPDELSHLQSQDMSKVGFIQDILRGVKKVLDASKSKPPEKASGASAVGATSVAPGVASLMKRGWLFLEDSDWKQANEYFDKVLDIDPEHAPAYVGKLCADLRIAQEEQLAHVNQSLLTKNAHYHKAIRFAARDYRAQLEEYNKTNPERIERVRAKREELMRLTAGYRGRIGVKYTCTVVLKANGTITAWGNNRKGQCNVPAGLTDVVQVVSGGSHTVALKADGTVVAWGGNEYGLCKVPAEVSGIAQIATSDRHTVALRADGTVVAWGDNRDGQCDVPAMVNDVVQVAAEGGNTVALRADGTVVALGNNYKGQCNVPAGLTDVVQVVSGGSHTVALKADGTVVAWGCNEYGQCKVPAGLTDVVQVAACFENTMALKADGTVVAWGGNGRGQCNVPAGLTDVVQVAVGSFHAVALKADGTVVAWGNNDDGQCNVPEELALTKQRREELERIETERERIEKERVRMKREELMRLTDGYRGRITAYGNTTVAVKANGTVVVCGDKNKGRSNVPAGLSGVVQVAAGYHIVALKDDGTVVAWGDNGSGQCNVPAGLGDVMQVAAGAFYTVALKTDGTVVTWGDGTQGWPIDDVPYGLNDVVQVAVGSFHIVALKTDGTVVAWGDNRSGQCNVPDGLNDVVQVVAGGSHTVALKADGTIVAWGYKDAYPSYFTRGLNAVQVAAGSRNTLAIKADGTVVAWGDNDDGQRNVPSGLNGVVQVAVGGYHAVALKADGTLVAWGKNDDGQCNVPAKLSLIKKGAKQPEQQKLEQQRGSPKGLGRLLSLFSSTKKP